MTQSRSGQSTYRPDLDGLRALAILSVLFYHCGIPHLTGGYAGVDIFFVLSGYLIGGQIYAELKSGVFTFTHFYQRRARRILPALFTVLAFTLALGMVLLSPAEAADLARSAFSSTLSASNILFSATASYFAAKSSLNPLLMTWSLGVEEQFYLVAPVAMMCIARLRRSLMLPAVLALCVVSFALCWIEVGRHPMFVFYSLPPRTWELGAGVALAIASSNRNRSLRFAFATQFAGVLGLALIVAPVFALDASTPFPGSAALPSVIGTALCILARSSWINRRLLSLPPITFVGRVSYSLYLWHWPLLAFLRIVYGDDPPVLLRFAAIAIAFGFAIASYYAIEQPFRRSKTAPALLLGRYAFAGACVLTLCYGIWLTGGLPQRFPALARMESTATTLKSDSCLARYGVDRPNLSIDCMQNTAPSQEVLALWGDSHAAALAPGMRAAARAQGLGFVQIGKAACIPVLGATHASPRIPLLAAECAAFNQRAFELIRSDLRIRVVVLNADWAGYLYNDWQDGWLAVDAQSRRPSSPEAAAALFTQSLAQTIRALQSRGLQVMVVRDVPSFAIDPLSRVRTASIPARQFAARLVSAPAESDPGFAPSARDPHSDLANTLLDQAIAAAPGASLEDVSEALCSASGDCRYRDGDRLLYADTNHLTAEGALRATAALRISPPPTATPQGDLANARRPSRFTRP